MTAALDFLAAL